MTLKGHKKHADITKPLGGKIHRNEYAIIGAPCGIIQKLSQAIATELKQYNVGYVDAEHNGETKGIYSHYYIDKINFHQLNFDSNHIDYEFRRLFNDSDLVLVNGNHFKAQKQVVIINQKKKESLQRKLDRLTDVLIFVLDEGEEELHEFLIEHNAEFAKVPTYPISDIEGISKAIQLEAKKSVPPIKGLVLAGGKSMRMGHDKGVINYHGKPQREFMAELLSEFCEETYLSMSKEGNENNFPVLVDSFSDLGPYGGILSAFRKDPNAAWLVVATDIPLLDKEALQFLIENRNLSKTATCFHNPETNFPEPLITLWEPRAYPRLLNFLSLGYSCPRKALINSDIEELRLERTEVLDNANTPEEMEAILSKING